MRRLGFILAMLVAASSLQASSRPALDAFSLRPSEAHAAPEAAHAFTKDDVDDWLDG